MGRRNKTYSKAEILEAINGSSGSISTIAQRLNCAWYTAEKNIRRFSETAEAFQGEIEITLDMAESASLELIKKGDGAMIRYYLSTKGRNRGYGNEAGAIGQSGEDKEIKIVIVD